MTLDLRSLKCAECGSGSLERIDDNEYRCRHCGNVSLVEDDVSQRLAQVLDQVKDAAAERLAAEQSQTRRRVGLVAGAGIGLLVAIFAVAFVIDRATTPKTTAPASSRGAVYASPADRSRVPPEGLKIESSRPVLAGSGTAAQPKLLVVARNVSGRPLERATVQVDFFDGDEKIATRSERLPLALLLDGESAPVLLDMPGPERRATRHVATVPALAAPYQSIDAKALRPARVRLVREGDDLRVVARLAHPGGAAPLRSLELLAVAYDAAGTIVAFGNGHARANEIKAGERTTFDVSLRRLGAGSAAVAAWDYRLQAHVVDAGAMKAAIAPDRIVRVEAPPEALPAGLRVGADELLLDDAERFDPARLALAPLVEGRDTVGRPLYLGEIVNASADRIAVAPAGIVSIFDGARLVGTRTLQGPERLLPGERFPFTLQPERGGRIGTTRVEWKPMRAMAPPGDRPPLEVTIDDTEAGTGSVLVNFSQRFVFKTVTVKGHLRNPGTGIVREPRLWIRLHDRDGRLTGIARVDGTAPVAPGDRVQFEASVQQAGRDFARVSVFHDAR